MSNAFVCIMGIGTVFFGLICLIFITKLVSVIAKFGGKEQPGKVSKTSSAGAENIENKEELVAAICAAIAEDLGTDANNIRVLSFKKL